MKVDPRTPVLVGVGQITDNDSPPNEARSPMDLAEEAARRAGRDAGVALDALDAISILRTFSDTSHRFANTFGRAVNPPRALARRLGAAPREALYTHPGGNMPQWLVNRYAELIAQGENDLVLIAGAEALRTWNNCRRSGVELDWSEGPDDPEPDSIGVAKRGWNDHEAAHGMDAAIVMYPLFENALRAHKGRSLDEHNQAMGRLFEPFAAVAKDNPYATRRQGYSAEEISRVDESNRMISFPYPKLMNANAYVDLGAAVLMSSTAKADELGVPQHRRVYLHGCSEASDHWYVSERENYHSCPAIRVCAEKAFEMAGKTVDDMAYFDLYSCFPSAVQIGCQEIGIAEDDPRGLTVTGGLPFFGGPGNNYVTHSIAAMVEKLRAKPGAYGLVTANGNYVTKHAFGVYSTTPTEGSWQREDPSDYQRELDARPKPGFTVTPDGDAEIETYTVLNARSGPKSGVIIGRLKASGERFLATPKPQLLASLQANEAIGRTGRASTGDDRNSWSFDS